MPGDRTADTSSLGLSAGGGPDLPGLREDAVLRGDPGGEPVAGPDDSALARAAAIRFPDLRGKSGRERVDALIDHITETAIARGELEELRLEANLQLRDAEAELAALPTGVTKSSRSAAEARRQARPELARRVDDARWLVTRCTEQITRMGGSEYDAASRAYTLLSGS